MGRSPEEREEEEEGTQVDVRVGPASLITPSTLSRPGAFYPEPETQTLHLTAAMRSQLESFRDPTTAARSHWPLVSTTGPASSRPRKELAHLPFIGGGDDTASIITPLPFIADDTGSSITPQFNLGSLVRKELAFADSVTEVASSPPVAMSERLEANSEDPTLDPRGVVKVTDPTYDETATVRNPVSKGEASPLTLASSDVEEVVPPTQAMAPPTQAMAPPTQAMAPPTEAMAPPEAVASSALPPILPRLATMDSTSEALWPPWQAQPTDGRVASATSGVSPIGSGTMALPRNVVNDAFAMTPAAPPMALAPAPGAPPQPIEPQPPERSFNEPLPTARPHVDSASASARTPPPTRPRDQISPITVFVLSFLIVSSLLGAAVALRLGWLFGKPVKTTAAPSESASTSPPQEPSSSTGLPTGAPSTSSSAKAKPKPSGSVRPRVPPRHP